MTEAATISDQVGQDENIARPVVRASPFVPRLGKRGQTSESDRAGIHRLLCATYGLDCGRFFEDLDRSQQSTEPTLRLINALVRSIAAQESGAATMRPSDSAAQVDPDDQVTQLELIEMVAQQMKREPRALENSESGAKRLAFTPRIG